MGQQHNCIYKPWVMSYSFDHVHIAAFTWQRADFSYSGLKYLRVSYNPNIALGSIAAELGDKGSDNNFTPHDSGTCQIRATSCKALPPL